MKYKYHYLSFIIISILFALGVFTFYLRNVNQLVEQARLNRLILIDMIFEQFRREVPENQSDFAEQAARYGDLTDLRVIITDRDSKLLADSGKNRIAGLYYDSVLADAKRGSASYEVLRDRLKDTLQLSVARPPESVGNREILIELSGPVPGIGNIRKIISQTVLFFILLLIFFLFILNSYFRQQVKSQIEILLKSTEEAIANGTERIEIDSAREDVVKIVEHFNVLLNRYNNLIIADNKKYSRINTVFSSIGSGIIAVDSGNKVSMVNPQAEKLLDIDKADLFSRSGHKNEISPLLAEILEQTDEVNQSGEARRFSLEAGDSVILDVTLTVIHNKYIPYDRFGVLAVVVDVTEMRRLENLRSEFISNVSHELRTPLTLISGFVETLKTWESLTPKDRNRSLDIIEIETDRLKRLIEELLLLSRIEGKIARKYEDEIDPGILVRDAFNSLKPLADEKGIRFVLNMNENIPSFKGISNWFRQIIINLCENAIKYTPDNGEISVYVRKDNDDLLITVKDNGIGIPGKDQEKIFERFYRVAKSRNSRIGGSGLGLAIARHIANEFGGDISLFSREGEGSEFTVKLPVHQKENSGELI